MIHEIHKCLKKTCMFPKSVLRIKFIPSARSDARCVSCCIVNRHASIIPFASYIASLFILLRKHVSQVIKIPIKWSKLLTPTKRIRTLLIMIFFQIPAQLWICTLYFYLLSVKCFMLKLYHQDKNCIQKNFKFVFYSNIANSSASTVNVRRKFTWMPKQVSI